MSSERRFDPIVFVPIGMMFLVLALVLPMVVHRGQQGFDLIHGILYGLAIGFTLLAVIFKAKQIRRQSEPPPTDK